MNYIQKPNHVRTCLILIAGMIASALLFPSLAAAISPDLPPRPQAQPTVSAGGLIKLIFRFDSGLASAAMGWQTMVQWQDALGSWHDVEGWRGTADQLYSDWGQKTWWLSEEHFGTGPFRWVVYDDDANKPIAVSDLFYLPHASGEVVWVRVTIPAP